MRRCPPPVPLELLPFGVAAHARARSRRRALRDVPPSPDGGLIADYLGAVGDPRGAGGAARARTPGVVEHGLFEPELVSLVLVGEDGGGVRDRAGAKT